MLSEAIESHRCRGKSMNATLAPPKPSSVERMVFDDRGWKDYIGLLDWLGESRIRVTFKEPTLEIMTLSFEHESWAKLIGRLIEQLTLEMRIPLQSGGSTTFRREDLRRGTGARPMLLH